MSRWRAAALFPQSAAPDLQTRRQALAVGLEDEGVCNSGSLIRGKTVANPAADDTSWGFNCQMIAASRVQRHICWKTPNSDSGPQKPEESAALKNKKKRKTQ